MVSRYVRSNIVGFVALFIALGGIGVAAGLKKNSVKSKQIKDGQVKSVDVADNGLTGIDIDESTLSGLPAGPKGDKGDTGETGEQGPPGANGSPDTAAQVLAKLLTVDGTGSNLDSDTLDGLGPAAFLGATASAGGDLTGNYPNPTVAANAIGSNEVTANSLTGADIDESTLAGVVRGGERQVVSDVSVPVGNTVSLSVASPASIAGTLAGLCGSGGAGTEGGRFTARWQDTAAGGATPQDGTITYAEAPPDTSGVPVLQISDHLVESGAGNADVQISAQSDASATANVTRDFRVEITGQDGAHFSGIVHAITRVGGIAECRAVLIGQVDGP